ncbi:B3/B4 domain-containing protein [Sunxiuqinia sp. A32]|uniref:B3/B4 domain-containing protein n=1 Tax=Sunxiuqinia sp. A32 TaxID=3461496 RepID=UPI004045A387
MNSILLSENICTACPEISLSCIECSVDVRENNSNLWQLINKKCDELSNELKTEQISKMPPIASARKAYKACGKDPARYRLSAEALLRRVVSGKGLYQINTVVDLLNLVSISTGYSIGGYDVDKILGSIELEIGVAGEPYIGLGRGELNIEGMPVFRDDQGAFGTSTSDSERTGVSLETKHFLMIIVSYGGMEGLEESTKMAVEYLKDFASADAFEIKTISGNL